MLPPRPAPGVFPNDAENPGVVPVAFLEQRLHFPASGLAPEYDHQSGEQNIENPPCFHLISSLPREQDP